jgi:Protein of unknown function (DUF1569)
MMKRRELMVASALSLTGVAMADLPKVDKVQTLSEALAWLDRLEKTAAASSAKTTGAWKMNMVLDHLAQSIEYSMTGFPAPNSALFQSTAGAVAFAYFKWRGQMSHGLAEPIPGAPALVAAVDYQPALKRLREAITRFNAHTTTLMPHFAYGHLSKSDFERAHSFHIANHQDELVL